MINPKPSSPNNSSKDITRALADGPLPLFIHEAKTQFEKLHSRQPVIGQLTSNFDVILKRQSIQPSYFDRAASWYSRRSWLDQGIMAAVLIGFSLAIGSIWGISALLTVISMSSYSFAAFILKDHQSVSAIRCQRLTADIKEMERALSQEVSELSQIERSLRNVLHQLTEEQKRLAKENTTLEALTQTLQQQVQQQTKTIQELHTAQTELTELNQSLAEQLQRVKLDLKKATSKLLQQSHQFDTLGIQVQTEKEKLEWTHGQFKPILEAYQARIQQLSTLTQLLNTRLETMNDPDLEQKKAISAHETDSEDQTFVQQAQAQLEAFDQLLHFGR